MHLRLQNTDQNDKNFRIKSFSEAYINADK
jgi:hypothetical protein